MNSTVSNAIKKRLWEEMTSKVNEVNRTVAEIKKKCSSLQSATKTKASQNGREAGKKGACPQRSDLTVLEDKITGIIGETAIEGVVAGIDSLENTEGNLNFYKYI